MDSYKTTSIKFGYYSSLGLTILTIITFGFAMMAIPPSGPFCPGNCMEYPFSDLLAYYPRDYYWMYLVIFDSSWNSGGHSFQRFEKYKVRKKLNGFNQDRI